MTTKYLEGDVKGAAALQLKAIPLIRRCSGGVRSDPGEGSPESDGQDVGPLRLQRQRYRAG